MQHTTTPHTSVCFVSSKPHHCHYYWTRQSSGVYEWYIEWLYVQWLGSCNIRLALEHQNSHSLIQSWRAPLCLADIIWRLGQHSDLIQYLLNLYSYCSYLIQQSLWNKECCGYELFIPLHSKSNNQCSVK